jgi:hypothetical protein
MGLMTILSLEAFLNSYAHGLTADSDERLSVLSYYTDGQREVAYDRHSMLGRLNQALNDSC